MALDGRDHILKGVTPMKLVVTFLVAVFVVVASTSFAFAECAGHGGAQMVKNQPNQTQEPSKDQLTSAGQAVDKADKTDQLAQASVKTVEKK